MDIEQLQEEAENLQKEINKLTYDLNITKQQRTEKQDKLNEINRTIEALNSDVTVTDHAVVRYFERVKGFDIEEIRNKILPSEVKPKIQILANCKYPLENFEIVVKNNKVVTVQDL